jgi:Holliday junction resolvase
MHVVLDRPALIGLALVALLLILLGWRLRRLWLAARLDRRRVRGARAEGRAVRLLERHGYAVVAEQESALARVLVDGEAEEYDLRADVIVEKDGERLVAEVKTGAAAAVKSRATRRQLLEYAYAYRLDAVLLVDMAEERIVRVEFPDLLR